jgi:hypothetical protein
VWVEKEDAKNKYGSENYFSAAMGGRSLRATAEIALGSGVYDGRNGMDAAGG